MKSNTDTGSLIEFLPIIVQEQCVMSRNENPYWKHTFLHFRPFKAMYEQVIVIVLHPRVSVEFSFRKPIEIYGFYKSFAINPMLAVLQCNHIFHNLFSSLVLFTTQVNFQVNLPEIYDQVSFYGVFVNCDRKYIKIMFNMLMFLTMFT